MQIGVNHTSSTNLGNLYSGQDRYSNTARPPTKSNLDHSWSMATNGDRGNAHSYSISFLAFQWMVLWDSLRAFELTPRLVQNVLVPYDINITLPYLLRNLHETRSDEQGGY